MVLVLLLPVLLILPGMAAWPFVERHGGEWIAVPVTLAMLSFLAYAIDKRRARRGDGRISEARLLLFDLLGGWPGGFVAQRLLRHKTAKTSYRLAFWFIVAVHQAAAAWRLFG